MNHHLKSLRVIKDSSSVKRTAFEFLNILNTFN